MFAPSPLPRRAAPLLAVFLVAVCFARPSAAAPDAASSPERLVLFPVLTPRNKDPQVRQIATETLRAGLAKSKDLDVVVFDPASDLVRDAIKRGRLSEAQVAGPVTGQTAPVMARALGGTYAVIGNIYAFSYVDPGQTWSMNLWVKILAADDGEILKEIVWGAGDKSPHTDDEAEIERIARAMSAESAASVARLLLDPKKEAGVTASKGQKPGQDWPPDK